MGTLAGGQLQFEIAPGQINGMSALLSGAKEADQAELEDTRTVSVQTEQNVTYPVMSLKVPVWTPEMKRGVGRRLATEAGIIYELLQGRLADEDMAERLLPKPEELNQAMFDVKHAGQQSEWLRQLHDFLRNDAWQAFLLRGMTQTELLNDVFSHWTKVEADHAGDDSLKTGAGELAAELIRLERKGPPIASGEWLAEAAAEGSLHQPGTQFHEIAERELPTAPVIPEVEEAWERLLPQAPRAREGLELVLRRVSEAAVERAKGIQRK